MKKHLQNIIESKNKHKLVVFVGSGISKSSETEYIKMPLWNDLIDELKNELNIKDESNYLKLAQLYYLEFGEFTYYNKLKNLLDKKLSPSSTHKLIFEIKPQYVITTNWDKLLDETIEENALIYDIVVSDKDLVKSNEQKKLIKMHGDFEHHNLVFKEDDYLNYSKDFPLIENFIKSILSTHTVIFLGYSYNDYNLKQIMKWIQSFSTVKPPAYLITSRENKSEILYLQNHGINTLVLDNKFGGTTNERIQSFLEKIKDNNFNLNDEFTFEETIEFFYQKLSPYNNLNSILIKQIQESLNEYIPLNYEENYFLLDFSRNENNYFKKFIEILKLMDENKFDKEILKKYQEKVNIIFKIFSNAGVGGILLTEKTYYKLDFEIYNKCNLKNIIEYNLDVNKTTTDLELAYIYYILNEKELSFKIYDQMIKESMKVKDYIQMFISMSNRNELLYSLRVDFYIKDRKKYQDIPLYDLNEKYHDIPNNVKTILEPIISKIKDFTFIYQFAFEITKLLKDKQDSKKTVENGGIVWSNNIYESSLKHKNLLYYLLSNGLLIERYNEISTILKNFIDISITRQSINENLSFNQLELFTCIKFVNEKELIDSLEEYIKKDSIKRLVLSDENIQYLITTLDNLLFHLSKKSSTILNIDSITGKVILLLSIIKLNKNDSKKIIDSLKKIIELENCSIFIYKKLNGFLGYQYSLYDEKFDNEILFNLLNIILSKIITKKYNGHDLIALNYNYINNLYGHILINSNKKFNDKVLIKQLLLVINLWNNKEQIGISKYFLINLYDISNNDNKKRIKKFISKISINNLEINELIDYNLFLLCNDLIKNKQLKSTIELVKQQLDDELKQYRDRKYFSTQLYGWLSMIKYLVKEKKYTELEIIYKELESIINNYKEPKPIF